MVSVPEAEPQGPFSEEMNLAMLRDTGAKYLLTKETGSAGGFPEKLAAARKASVTAVVIANPEARDTGEKYDFEDFWETWEFGAKKKKGNPKKKIRVRKSPETHKSHKIV